MKTVKELFFKTLLFLLLAKAAVVHAQNENIIFPTNSGVRNIKTDYGAKGDGITDDTEAIQKAIDGQRWTYQTIYFPNGTYLVSRTLDWRDGTLHLGPSLQGQSRDGVVIKLKDNSGLSGPVIITARNATNADHFHCRIKNLTIHTGSGNPDASGITFYSNNTGSLKDVKIISGDGQGDAGMYLLADQNGPCLFKNIEVEGFNYGVRAGNGGVNSLTFENISLKNQKICGFRVDEMPVFVRNLTSVNSVPAVWIGSALSAATIVESSFTGGSSSTTAIVHENGTVFFRNITSQGYKQVLQSNVGISNTGTQITEFAYPRIDSKFSSPQVSLNLPVEEAPVIPWEEDMSQWANVEDYGAVADGKEGADDTQGIQAAIDAGKTTVYIPNRAVSGGEENRFTVDGTIYIRGNVRRIVGLSPTIKNGGTFVVEDGTYPVVEISGIYGDFGNMAYVRHTGSRTLIIRNCEVQVSGDGSGKMFLEDYVGRLQLNTPNYQAWARQLNAESFSSETRVINQGSKVWILGLKSESDKTVVQTTNGGTTEVLGALLYANYCYSYTNPAFIVGDASNDAYCSFAGFRQRHYCEGEGFTTLVRETRGGVAKDFLLSQSANEGSALYVAYTANTSSPPPAPSNLAAAATAHDKITLSWTDNSTNEDGFKIERKDSTSGTYSQVSLVSQDTTRFIDKDLAPSTTYYYRVRSYNAAGASEFTPEVSATTQPLPDVPSPWVSTAIAGAAGTAKYQYDSAAFSISSSGYDIWNTSDQFQFVSQAKSGDGHILARFTSQTNPDGWSKAGLMFRETLNANSKFVMVAITPSNGLNLLWRDATGGGSAITFIENFTFPIYLKLARIRNTFTLYTSKDGKDWGMAKGTVTNAMDNATQVGMAVSSHSAASSTATMDRIEVFNSVSVTGITVSPTSASVGVNATQQLTATVAPADASNKTVNWTSDNTSVATVSSTGLVTGVGIGTATITATTAESGFQATCTITTTNIPGTIEAEAYSTMSGIQTQASDEGGTLVGFIDAGDWMEYQVNVATAGVYTFQFRVAGYGGAFEIKSGNTVLGSAAIPPTGGWQAWTIFSTNVTLSAGTQTIRFTATEGSWNFDRWKATQPPVLPGTIQAEEFTAMSGIQTQASDEGGTLVGFIDAGDWIEYQVNPSTAGIYILQFRVAGYGGAFEIKSGNDVLGTVTLPGTGGWQTWNTISTNVSLQSGLQALRFNVTQGSWNFDRWKAMVPTALPGAVEAEDYTSMSGIVVEAANDGTQLLGYIDAGDWMEYQVSPTTSGMYTLQFKVSGYAGAIEIKSGSTVLDTLTLAPTNAWQNWNNIPITVNLSAGFQTLRFTAVQGSWNFNSWKAFLPIALPGQVEAEDYSNMSGVKAENKSDGGQQVGFIDPGDWMEYWVNPATTGAYYLEFRVAGYGGGFEIKSGDQVLSSFALESTGGWQSWVTVSTSVNLTAGLQIIRLRATKSLWNIDWWKTSILSTVTGITLSPTSVSLAINDTQQLTATISPANASNKNVTWTSSNTSVATVSSNGLVTAVAAGEATITATTQDGGKMATCAITVNASTGTGLTAQYYDNMDLTNLKVTRTDAVVDFNWGDGSPDPSIGADSFSARWTGEVQPRYSETYTFYIRSDNGRRVWVNDQLIIDQWVNNWDVTYSGTIALQAGQKYAIKIEYFEDWGGANIKFEWESASQARQVVPKEQLYPSTASAARQSPLLAVLSNASEKGWFTCYPNPVMGKLQLRFLEESAQNRLVQIFSMDGKKLITQEISGAQTAELDVSNLVQGTYLLNVVDGQRPAKRIKFIKL